MNIVNTKKPYKRLSFAVGFTILGAISAYPSMAHEGPHFEASTTVVSKFQKKDRAWLAGDHHIHSRYSVGYEPAPNDPTALPTPIIAGDAVYPIPTNAHMARHFGLSWMVSTDHGGPNHAKLNAEQAYPELLQSRRDIPELLQFYGMEFDTPGADHSSLIIPHTETERQRLHAIESQYSKKEAWPLNPEADKEPRMIAALKYMKTLDVPPVLFANHPSRSAKSIGVYGLDHPAELRSWNDTAPTIAIGMEGAPGHQAASLNPDGTIKPDGVRGAYGNAPTLGGYDQMTARLGGFWDSMLGEGRHWWITASSDSHQNYTEGGHDFWPGEYAKTYVYAQRHYDDVLDGLRAGRVFVTTGDLISSLDMKLSSSFSTKYLGETLIVKQGRDVTLHLTVRDPAGANISGHNSEVARIDIIVGEIQDHTSADSDHNPSTRVVKRFYPSEWRKKGEMITITYRLENLQHDSYVRVRGTNTQELEPSPDPKGEDPWADLWFYTNPIFIKIKRPI